MQNIGFDKTIKKDASTDDTLRLIVSTANQYSKSQFAIHAAAELCPKGTSKEQCLRNVFEFYTRNVKYKLDPKGIERIYTPNRTIIEGQGDCKKAATFIASILLAAGIKPIFKHVTYEGNGIYTHIYIIVGTPEQYITLDPTNGGNYDSEVSHKNATLYYPNGKKMELKLMGNPSNLERYDSSVSGINWSATCGTMENDIQTISDCTMGAANPRVSHLTHSAVMHKMIPNKPHLQKALQNIPVANQRGAFLELINHNYNGIATALVTALAHNPDALNGLWKEIGGDLVHLKQTVLKGASAKPMKGTEYIGFSLKKFLHAAAGVLHVVATVISNIPGVPPSIGDVLNKVADTAQNIATDPRTPEIEIHDKHIDKVLPPDPTGMVIVNPNQRFQKGDTGHGGEHRGSFFSIGGFIFKSILIIHILNINEDLKPILGTMAVVAPLLYFILKNKLKTWQI